MMREQCTSPLVSIIIPVYNTELYLKKCLDSIVGQTYKELEIICIDDGSTDESGMIIDEYAQNDLRIKVIHKENGGESSARNVGLKIMTGQYVGFVDCDDWLELDMYEQLVSSIVEKDVDMVASAWFKSFDENEIRIINQLPVSSEVLTREELLNYIYKRDYYRGFAYMWNKLYKRSLFYNEYNSLMMFDEDLVLGGDVLYLGKLALNTNSAYYLDKAFYHYYQRNTSGCHTIDLRKRKDWLEAYKRLISYAEGYQVDKNILIWIKRFLAYHSSNVAELAYEQKDGIILKECQEIMRKYSKQYYQTNQNYEERITRFRNLLGITLDEKVM